MEEKERIAVLGATGLVGKAVTDTLITKGNYAVNAFMRNPECLGINSAFCTIIQGDVNNQAAVEQALKGCIAVVVAISRPMDHDNEVLTEAARVISAACIKSGVKRVVQVAGMGIVPAEGKLLLETSKFPQEYVNVCKDHMAAFNIYKNAGLEVTAICPPNINDVKFTGNYAVEVERVSESNKWNVGNREVADFILQEIQNPKYEGKRVSISSTD